MELAGRWSGLEGRSLERPALLLTLPGGGGGRLRCEALAPTGPAWTARDGELWSASFAVGADLTNALSIELSAGSEVLVALIPPWAPHDVRPSALGGVSEEERAETRRADAEDTLEHERVRRTGIEHALDREQAENRDLRTALAALTAELELLRAAHEQALLSNADLEARAAESERGAGAAERRAAELEAFAAAADHRATESEIRALDAEQRASLLQAAAPEAGVASAETGAGSAERGAAGSTPTDADTTAVRAPSTPGQSVAPVHAAAQPVARRRRKKHKPKRARPLNPSLRHRTWWLGRLVAVIIFGAVIVAIVLLINSNHLH